MLEMISQCDVCEMISQCDVGEMISHCDVSYDVTDKNNNSCSEGLE